MLTVKNCTKFSLSILLQLNVYTVHIIMCVCVILC